MKTQKKELSGNSLYLVVFISFIVAVLLLLLISNSYYSQVEVIRYKAIKEMIDLNRSALLYELSRPADGDSKDWKELTLFEKQAAITEVFRSEWGVYNIAGVKSSWKNIEFKKIAFCGQRVFHSGKTGLYMADEGKYLSIAGTTRLTGDCYLPSLGIRSVYIDGKPYSGKKLMYGTEKRSKNKLPEIDPILLQKTENLLEGIFDSEDSLGSSAGLFGSETIERSFEKSALIYDVKGAVVLDNMKLNGKIIIRSDSLVFLGSNLHTSDIIVVAPIVVADKSFKGSIQIVARDSVLIDKDCELDYPSSIMVYNYAGTKAFCYIQENVLVSGGIVCITQQEQGNSELILSKGSVVSGIVYTSGKTTLSGSVYGSLFTNSFYLKTPRGYYEDHLLEGVVDPESLLPDFAGPSVFVEQQTRQEIIQWVN
jgi:hypothetical protein